MERYIKWLLGLYILFIYAGSASATDVGYVVNASSNDFSGVNTNRTTYGGTWLTAYDSIYPTSGNVGNFGAAGGGFYMARSARFTLVSIPQGSTIDSVEYWVTNGSSGCATALLCNTAHIKVRAFAYNADNAGQIVDTSGFRTAWAAKTTAADTAEITNATTWTSLGTRYLVPYPRLKNVVQEVVNRAGWASNNALTILMGVTGDSPDSARAFRNYDSHTKGDSIWIRYSAASGGGGGATPNTVLRGVTVRGSIIRAPEKMFRREESWKW